jgi:hypothetical protein
MAMNSATMGALIKTQLDTDMPVSDDLTSDQISELESSRAAFALAIAQGAVLHIQAAAVTATPGAQAGGATLPGTVA